MEEGAYEGSTGNGRRIRKPLDNDFLYYAQPGSTGEPSDSTISASTHVCTVRQYLVDIR